MKQLIKSAIKYIHKIKDKTNEEIEEVIYYYLNNLVNEKKPNKSKVNIDFKTILEMLKNLEGTSLVEGLKIIESVIKTNHISGDICEFGVAQGKMTKILSYLINKNQKKFYIYDSFEGLPAPTKEDELKDDIFKLGNIESYKGKMSHNEKKVFRELQSIKFDLNRLIVNKGFFNQKNLNNYKFPKNISFAYIDFDFYLPTKDVLETIENKLMIGSIMIVDDYDFFSTGVKKAVDEWHDKKKQDFKILKIKTTKASFVIIEKIR
tara:strand:- start:1455 stop:2243 length:789 start_codon:yes stop_codon:yes gene_type:complete